jgi:hypothetical protein
LKLSPFGSPFPNALSETSGATLRSWVTRPPHFNLIVAQPSATMPDGPGYHNRQLALAAKIRALLCSLSPSTYEEIAPNIEYWIEYGITEQFTTIDDLVERVSSVS